MNAPSRIALVTMLAVGLLAGGMPGEALAKKKNKAVVSAKVDGKKFKNTKRVPVIVAYQTLTGLVTLQATAAKGGVRRVSVKILNFSLQADLATATLPLVVPAFTALYSDETYRGPVSPGAPKSWAGEGLTVTITSYDGVRIAGTFEGTLPPGGGGVTSPATFVGGKFDAPILVQ